MQLPLNVSSVSTSFFGLTRLGIHLVLFLACRSLTVSNALRIFSRFRLPLLLFSLLSAKLKKSCFAVFSCSSAALAGVAPHQLECGKPPVLAGSAAQIPFRSLIKLPLAEKIDLGWMVRGNH